MNPDETIIQYTDPEGNVYLTILPNNCTAIKKTGRCVLLSMVVNRINKPWDLLKTVGVTPALGFYSDAHLMYVSVGKAVNHNYVDLSSALYVLDTICCIIGPTYKLVITPTELT